MTLQQLIALQKASGGQNTITPENAGRIMGLAAQAEANRQLSMDAGKLAVEERKRLQQLEAGQTPGVVTAPSGAKFVTDAQGNVVGTNAPIGVGAGGIGDRAAINRGEATAQERALLGPAIREAFQLEMQKRPPAPAPVAKAPVGQPTTTPAQSAAFVQATAPSLPPTAPEAKEEAPAFRPPLEYKSLLEQASQAEQGIATEEQTQIMKEVAAKRREEMDVASKLQEALRTGNRAKISSFRKEMERIRKEMLASRERAYPGSTTALSPTEALKERMLLQD
jgi:hypothetical protein